MSRHLIVRRPPMQSRLANAFTAFMIVSPCMNAAAQSTHELKLMPQNIHWGYYDARLKPILRIMSGDTVRIETMVARGLERMKLAGAKDDEIPQALKVVEETVKDRGPGAHPMTGPIFIEGAEPGDSLEV